MFRIAFLVLVFMAASLSAQVFRRGALYDVSPIEKDYEGQVFELSPLSGSWRIVDIVMSPFQGLGWGAAPPTDDADTPPTPIG